MTETAVKNKPFGSGWSHRLQRHKGRVRNGPVFFTFLQTIVAFRFFRKHHSSKGLFYKSREELHSPEVDLLIRSGSAVDPMEKNLLTTLGKPSSIKARGLIRLTWKAPPLKRENGVG
jgi:hypothetical protein